MLDLALKVLSLRRVSVFAFHKVHSEEDPLAPYYLTLSAFERMLDFIAERFRIIPLDDAVSALARGTAPPNAACLTFDDGYPSWLTGTIDALAKRQAHATFYITTCQFDGLPMWNERVACAIHGTTRQSLDLGDRGIPSMPLADVHSRQRAFAIVDDKLKYMPVVERNLVLQEIEAQLGVDVNLVPRMSVDDLRAIHAKGFAIGGHTVNHPILNLCSPAEARMEIGAVKEVLEGYIRAPVRSFAYPNGRPRVDFSADHVRMVREAGYAYAVTTDKGAASTATPPYQIPRFTPWGPTATRMELQLGRNLMAGNRALPE